MMTDDIL